MGSGKSGGGSKDYYGHCAGVVCQGQLDFIWGLLINNNLAWPDAKLWDSQIWQKNKIVIWTDGKAYKATQKTNVDPPTFPWTLDATNFVHATAYANGTKVVSGGNVYQNTSGGLSSTDPPSGQWTLLYTPNVWASTNYWLINSIVAWNGRLWTNSSATKNEPPAAPWSLWKQDVTGSNPFKFTVTQNGDCYLYTGTANQALDTVNEQILSQLGHPPYRNKSVLVLKNFLFGTSQQTPPDVILLGGRKPIQTLIINNTGVVGVDATAMDADWQVNPWCVFAEMLTHPAIGLGLPNSMFDATTWQAEADRCAANPQLYYISPMYNSLKKLREIAGDLLSYPDSFVFWSILATLTAGHWPHAEAAPAFTSANTINRDSLQEEIKWDTGGWSDTANSVQLSFEDVQSGFKARPVFAQNLFNLNAVRKIQAQSVDRPFITRFDQASAWAAEFAKIAGDQQVKGELVVLAEKATAIKQGVIFLLTDDVLGVSMVCRCTKKQIMAPPSGLVRITYETERGVSPQPYSPTGATPSVTSGPPPSIIKHAQLVQLPSQLGGAASTLACLASRTSDATSGFEVWFQQKDTLAFQLLAQQNGFVVSGFGGFDSETQYGSDSFPGVTVPSVIDLAQNYIWNVSVTYTHAAVVHAAVEGTDYLVDPVTGTLTLLSGGAISNGDQVDVAFAFWMFMNFDVEISSTDIEGVSAPLTQDEVLDGTLLLFAFQEGNPQLFEIISVSSVSNVGGGFQISGIRGFYGTLHGGDGTHHWQGNDPMFMIYKKNIVPLQHESFAGFQATNALTHFRLAPTSAFDQADVADVYDAVNNPTGLTTAFDYTWDNLYAPTVTWIQKQKDGVADTLLSVLDTNVLNVVFQVNDANADIAHVALILEHAGQETTLFAKNYGGTAQETIQATFTLASTQRVRLKVACLDLAGNQSVTTYPSDGTSILVSHAGGTQTGNPTILSYQQTGEMIHDLYFGTFPNSTDTVKYELKASGADSDATGAGGYSTAPSAGAVTGGFKYGPVPPFKSGTKTLYSYRKSAAGGATNSDIVQWNL